MRENVPFKIRALRLLIWILSPIIIAVALVLHLRQGAPYDRFKERLGKGTYKQSGQRVIWIHAASLGEVKQVAEIIRHLAQNPKNKILITTLTKSSADWVEASIPAVIHQFCPLDFPRAMRRFLSHWKPAIGIVVENDLWPEMIQQASADQIPLLQLNARSSRARQKYPIVTGYLSSKFDAITCASDAVVAELISIGVAPNVITRTSDLKSTSAPLPIDPILVRDIDRALGQRRVWVAASTHESDIDYVLSTQHHLAPVSDALLIWAPRHPRSAQTIKRRAQSLGLRVAQRSVGEDIKISTDIYLADTLGELGSFFTLSDHVYLGGGLGAEGGHNPYEPYAFNCVIFSGPKVANFQGAFDMLKKQNAVTFVQTPEVLSETLEKALMDRKESITKGGGVRAPFSEVVEADMAVTTVIDLIQARLGAS